jgi:hypothetical protein
VCVSLDGRGCVQVQMRTLAMHIPSPLNMAQATPLSLQADSFYFGGTKTSRAVSHPSAPSAVVARQRMQADPPMHLEANGDTSRSRGGAALRASTREDGCTVCGVNVPITAPAMCDGLVPETCCFVKSACARHDDAYCDMKLSRRLAETTCRRNLTHTISLTRIFTGIPYAKIPASRPVGFSCTRQWFGGGTNYFHRSTVPSTHLFRNYMRP